jgi:hypothetical protein
MASRSLIALSALTSAWFVAVPARAHVSLNAPKSRYWQASSMQADQNKLKNGPCGVTGDSRTSNAALITTYTPGQKLMVTWKETVQHPGHFEISFDSDGQDFPTPGTAPSATSGVTVLAANIADKSSSDYTYEVTLPNMECSKCTLQLVQVMTTKAPPYGSGDLYFNCADIIIKADGAGGSGGAGSAGSAGTAGNAGSAGATPGGSGNASGGSGAAGGLGLAGSGSGGTTAAGASGMGPIGGAAGAAGMVTMGAGGAPNTGFGGMAGSTSSAGGMLSSGGATSSGGAPLTSGGASSTSGGALVSSGGSPVGTSGAGTNPPGGPHPEEPEGGCTLARPSSSRALGWLAAAAGALGLAARRRRRQRG